MDTQFFDFGSPTAYLAHTQLSAIAERSGAELVYRPMLLGGVFQATGNTTPAAIPAKGKYMGRDIARCAARYGEPYHSNPHFPVNTLNVMRGAVAAQQDGVLKSYMDAVYRAVWVDQKNTADPEVFAEVLVTAGLDAENFAERIQDPAIKDGLKKQYPGSGRARRIRRPHHVRRRRNVLRPGSTGLRGSRGRVLTAR